MVGGPPQEEYHQQCNYYITVILQSGLLLDEDLQALSTQYSFNYDKLAEKKKTQLWPVALTGVAALCSLYWLKKSSVSIAMACTTPAIGLALICTLKAFHKKKQMRYIDLTVECLKEVVMLNKLIVKYLRDRIVASKSNGDGIFVAYTSRIEDMVKFIVDAEIDILKQLKKALLIFSRVVGEIKDSYLYLDQIDLNLFRLHSVESAEECITFFQKFSGMFILYASHCLSCLGLTLCPSLWLPSSKLPDVFDATSSLKNGISLIVPGMKVRFNAVKFDLHRKLCDVVSKNKTNKTSGGSALRSNVAENLMHAAFISEQANGILERMYDGDVSALLKNLESLRDSTSDYCDKLNVLCQMCSNEIAPRKETMRQIQNEVDERSDDVASEIDDSEPAEPTSDDDVYELDMQRVPRTDESNQNSFIDVDDSASVRFASLMVQELKHSLKSDQRFVAAREKRGIVDVEPIKPKEKTVINPESPAEVIVLKQSSCPAPPPPPFPSSSSTTIAEDHDDDGTGSDFSKAIKGEYAKRNIVVDLIEDRDD